MDQLAELTRKASTVFWITSGPTFAPFAERHQKTSCNTGLFQLKENAATINRGTFGSIRCFVAVAGSRSAEDFAEDVADAATIIAPAVVAVVVVATILPKSCRIALHEAISKLPRPGVLVIM
jgi:hypothetical protein